ncbi:hypothetical protein CK203_026419 [Vitis vinifera]|uniref:Uncharacterized protein n=1 Tax=Vitis vinifera TaxID=29760 RepID=A0A438IVN0_VITVI|nr:hypothetical protein CK203_026419 [Vitis vinifera]
MRCRHVSIASGDIEGHILPFHSICLPQVHDQRHMIQRVGTVESTFARCFDTFILGHAPILACWLWFLCMYASIPSCLAMLWASKFEGVHTGAYLIHCPGHTLFFSSVNGDCDFSLVIYWHFLVLHQGIPLSFFMMEVFYFWLLRVICWQSLDVILGAYLFVIKFGGSPASRLNSIPCSTRFQYSPGFYPFSVFARTLLRYSPGLFFGTRPNSTIFQYLSEPFSGTCPNSTIFRYLPEPFFGTRPDSSLVLTQIPPFFSTCLNPSPTLLWYSPRFHLFPKSRPDSTRFRYWPGPFSDTRPDSTRFRYLPGPFSGTCPDPFPVPSQTLLRYLPRPFFGTRSNSTLLLYLPRSDPLSFPAS